MEDEVYAVLSGAAAVTAIVGSGIYLARMEQGAALPALVFQRISTTPSSTLSGINPTTRARLQVDAWAETFAEADALAAAARAALLLSKSIWLDQRYLFENDTRVHRVSMDFSVWYQL